MTATSTIWTPEDAAEVQMPAIAKLQADIRRAAALGVDTRQASLLVSLYYDVQDFRKAANEQARHAPEEDAPYHVSQWVAGTMKTVEDELRKILGGFAAQHVLGQWAQSITGIGPVISAGLVCHVHIEHCPTAGHLWSYAGLNPEQKWEKGQKRPWNAALKRLCYLVGESFVKFQNHPNDHYGQLFVQRKLYETTRNEQGLYAEQAAAILERKRIGKDTDAYAAYSIGKLPKAHIHARARRWVVKLFLAHAQEVAWTAKYGTKPVKPYIFEHGEGEHVHLITPPNWPMA